MNQATDVAAAKKREAQVREVQDARWRVAAADRDAERRWDLSGALGWNLPEDPADERDEPPTWAEIVEGIKGLREMTVVPVGEQRVPCTCGYDWCTGTAMVSKWHDDPEAEQPDSRPAMREEGP